MIFLKAENHKKAGKKAIILALFTSGLLFLAFPGGVGLGALAWLALVPLFLALRDKTPGTAAGLGLLAGLVHYLGLLYWVVIVLGRYGQLPWWVSLPALLLLALYMSLYFAGFAALAVLVMQRSGLFLLVVPALWVGLDFLRGLLFSGFPWQDLAYSQYRYPLLIQVADLAGHHLVTYLIVMVNCLVFLLAVRAPARRIPVLAGILALALGMIYNVLQYRQVANLLVSSETIRVAVVQGNISQELKWTAAMQEKTVAVYTDLSRKVLGSAAERPVLLVWPETALPFYLQDKLPFSGQLNDFVRAEKVWLLTGVPSYEPSQALGGQDSSGPRYYNSAVLLPPAGGLAARYDKEHLVPFGEYIPLRRFLPLPGPLVASIGDFTPGTEAQPISCQKARIGVLICFESIFPDLARQRVAAGANLLVNITNDAWFGRSSAPWQHLSMAVFRAVENRRSLARAANTGISGFVDPLGRLSGDSPIFSPYYALADLPLLAHKTLFVRYGRGFVIICFLLAASGLAAVLFKRT